MLPDDVRALRNSNTRLERKPAKTEIKVDARMQWIIVGNNSCLLIRKNATNYSSVRIYDTFCD